MIDTNESRPSDGAIAKAFWDVRIPNREMSAIEFCELVGTHARELDAAQPAPCSNCRGTGLANVVDPDDGALVVDDCPVCGGETAQPAARLRIVRQPLLVSGMLADSADGPTILIDSESSADEQALALWHEVVHMVSDAEGLPQDEESVERDARRIVAALAQPDSRGGADAELQRLRALIDSPELHDFSRGVTLEAAHQRERWGNDHDAGKEPADWFWLIGYLAGKALNAHVGGNTDKALHHTISTAAALANWHGAILGTHNMRPGIDGEAAMLAAAPSPTPQPTKDEPVGRLNVSRFRGSDAMVNHDFDYFGNLPDGNYALYTRPHPSGEDARDAARYRWMRSNCERNALGDELDSVCDAAIAAQQRKGEG